MNFYKVGHHGSHNATPLEFVEKHLGKGGGKREDLWAMVSVRPYPRWPNIPRLPLLDRLHAFTDKVARSDVDEPHAAFERRADWWVENKRPDLTAHR